MIDINDVYAAARAWRTTFEARKRAPFEDAKVDFEAIWDKCFDAAHAGLGHPHDGWERSRTEQVMMLIGFHRLAYGFIPTDAEIAAINAGVTASCVFNPKMVGGVHQ